MPEENEKVPAGETDALSCFVVSAFGVNTEEKKRYEQVLRHLVQKALGERFRVVRADEIDDEGLITNQIIEHLIEDDLVVADLTGLNPNVFYEVAVRHAAGKPIVHLITRGQEIPFDVANMRAVPYALDDPDALEFAQEDLARKVKAIERGGWRAAPNPITAARRVALLQESEQPEIKEAGDILAAVGELRDEIRSLSRRLNQGETQADPQLERAVIDAVSENDPITAEDLRRHLPPLTIMELAELLSKLLKAKEIYLVDGKYSMIPF